LDSPRWFYIASVWRQYLEKAVPETPSLTEIAETILESGAPQCDVGLRFDHKTIKNAALEFTCTKASDHDGPHSHGEAMDGISFIVAWTTEVLVTE
jgi:hypothetical protein